MRSNRDYHSDFRAFVERFGAGMGRDALDGFDISSISVLRGREREQVVELLTAMLAESVNDPRIPEALAALRSDTGAAALAQRAATGDDDTAVEAAAQLWRYEHSPEAISALLRTLRDGYLAYPRATAALVLGAIPGEEITAALIETLDDQEDVVRSQVLRALEQRTGLDGLVGRSNRLALLEAQFYGSLRSLRTEAIAQLRALFSALRSGQTPESLGLCDAATSESAALDRLRCSVFGPKGVRSKAPADVDLEAFANLAGPERLWGEQFILELIGEGDERGLAAAAALRADWALPALREVAGRRGRIAAAAKRVARDIAGQPC